MIVLGSTFLLIGLIASAWALCAGAFAGFRLRPATGESAENALHVATATTIAAAVVLVRLLIARDYRVAYVWEYTSNTLPAVYAFTALWAGQAGSLLFWLTILGVVASLAVMQNRERHPEFHPHMVWILSSIQFFFFLLLNFAAPPFELLIERHPESAGAFPFDGNGLNPQLQNFGMIIHPPLLYLGYIAISVPFAFAMAALASGRTDIPWFRSSRPWSIFSWTILGFGILCGARWAYVELGWGGYWAWDPVENASLMPWLTSTAFIHSVMIEERQGMLRRWNIFLVTATFLLSVFGTFLTRSGILSSVHSFAQSNVGELFIYFIAAWAILATGLFILRWKSLASKNSIESIVSREAAFLFQNLLLVGICASILWGTLYPLFTEYFTDEKVNVHAPYFNTVILPLGLALYILVGAGPMVPWRNATISDLRRLLGLPALLGVIVSVAAFVLGVRNGMAVLAFGIAAFIFYATLLDLLATARARSEKLPRAILIVIDKNHRRYGGFLAHVGMAILLVGLAGNAFNKEREEHLAPGELINLGHYTAIYRGHETGHDGHRHFYRAKISVYEDGHFQSDEYPEISVYFGGTERETRNSEVAIRSGVLDDLYLIFAEPDGENAVIRAEILPLVAFVWAGGMITVLGALIAVIPWRFAFRAAPIILICAAAHAEYTHALGNRDPVSHQLACLCGGCRMILSECDMPNCRGQAALDELAVLRGQGLSEDQMRDKMAEKYGPKVLAMPPGPVAWIVPFAGVAIAAITLTVLLVRKKQ